jgi:tRNA dimethylallyltransferase
MIDAGLVAEVEALRAQGYRPPMRSQQAIGYAELHAQLDGALELPRAVELIKRNSRRYARRQLAWYRSDVSVEWSSDASRVDLDSLQRYLRRP